ncbi:MAG: DNA repair protein RadC [Lachnospiraceae bacterium]|nr:DNA repair protein RadC [Lachnospiraceae bacterium]
MDNRKKQRIKDLPADERPYEKCLRFGPEVLSDCELLAVFLRTGASGCTGIDISREVLSLPDGSRSLSALLSKSTRELLRIRGIGEVKAITLKCIAEISRRLNRPAIDDKVNLNNPQSIAAMFMDEMCYLDHEEVRVVCLNGANRYITDEILTKGTVNRSLISTREIYKIALLNSAVGIVLLHNHPGGDPSPSENDILVTDKVKKAGELMDIKLIDHLIIGGGSFVSMRGSGYIR